MEPMRPVDGYDFNDRFGLHLRQVLRFRAGHTYPGARARRQLLDRAKEQSASSSIFGRVARLNEQAPEPQPIWSTDFMLSASRTFQAGQAIYRLGASWLV